MTIIEEIAAERTRQVTAEGWSEKHDDQHSKGEIADAAACYAAGRMVFTLELCSGTGYEYEPYCAYFPLWPWAGSWWKLKDRRCDLIRAAALIVAEIERLDRAMPKS